MSNAANDRYAPSLTRTRERDGGQLAHGSEISRERNRARRDIEFSAGRTSLFSVSDALSIELPLCVCVLAVVGAVSAQLSHQNKKKKDAHLAAFPANTIDWSAALDSD